MDDLTEMLLWDREKLFSALIKFHLYRQSCVMISQYLNSDTLYALSLANSTIEAFEEESGPKAFCTQMEEQEVLIVGETQSFKVLYEKDCRYFYSLQTCMIQKTSLT